MINPIKDLPKEIKKVVLKVESTTEYQIKIAEEVIDIKNFYLTSANDPITTFSHGDNFNVVVNSEYLKVNNDYVNQVLVSILRKIKYQHIVFSNIRFINEKMINQLLDQTKLEVVEFKNMLITRPMINRLKFLETLKVIIGQDIEDAAYKELLDRDIDALTIKKINFNTELFNEFNLTKSSATFMHSININSRYDEQELQDFNTFLNNNHKLKNIYLKCDLDLYFVKDIISVIHKTNHKELNLIIDHSADAQKSVDILIQLHNAFGDNNKIIININTTLVDLTTYKLYIDAVNKLSGMTLSSNLSPLERIYKVYENVLSINMDRSIRHLLYFEELKANGINHLTSLNNQMILMKINDPDYSYNGLLVSDIVSSDRVNSGLFLRVPTDLEGSDLPIFRFLNADTHQEMKDFLQNTKFEDLMTITNEFYEVFKEEYNFDLNNVSLKNITAMREKLEQVYVQNRTNEFEKKIFYSIFCNVKKEEGLDNINIINQIKTIISSEQTTP